MPIISLKRKKKSRWDNDFGHPLLGIVVFLAFVLLFWWAIDNVGYFWVMLVPNFLLLVLTFIFLIAYLSLPMKKNKPLKEYPSMSVIVPAYNASKTIGKAIDAIKASRYPGELEIIVVDDGSKDETYKITKEKGVKVIRHERNLGKASALNNGILAAKGELVACIDSDTYISKDALRLSAEEFDEKTAAVTVLIKVHEPETLIERLQELEYAVGFGLYALVGKWLNIIFVTPGPMTVFKRKILIDVGLFDVDNVTEDLEIAWRLREKGYKIGYALDAVVYTEVPPTWRALLKQRLRWYRGKLLNIRRYKHMLFNPKYEDFGMFMLPFTFTAELMGITLTSLLFIFLVKQGLWFFTATQATLAAHAPFAISTFTISGISALVMAFFLILPLLFVAYVSRVLTAKKFDFGDFIIALLTAFVYSVFTSFAYFLSFFQEISGVSYKW